MTHQGFGKFRTTSLLLWSSNFCRMLMWSCTNWLKHQHINWSPLAWMDPLSLFPMWTNANRFVFHGEAHPRTSSRSNSPTAKASASEVWTSSRARSSTELARPVLLDCCKLAQGSFIFSEKKTNCKFQASTFHHFLHRISFKKQERHLVTKRWMHTIPQPLATTKAGDQLIDIDLGAHLPQPGMVGWFGRSGVSSQKNRMIPFKDSNKFWLNHFRVESLWKYSTL